MPLWLLDDATKSEGRSVARPFYSSLMARWVTCAFSFSCAAEGSRHILKCPSLAAVTKLPVYNSFNFHAPSKLAAEGRRRERLALPTHSLVALQPALCPRPSRSQSQATRIAGPPCGCLPTPVYALPPPPLHVPLFATPLSSLPLQGCSHYLRGWPLAGILVCNDHVPTARRERWRPPPGATIR